MTDRPVIQQEPPQRRDNPHARLFFKTRMKQKLIVWAVFDAPWVRLFAWLAIPHEWLGEKRLKIIFIESVGSDAS